MTTVTSTDQAGSSYAAFNNASAATGAASANSGQDRFLSLLVAQMKNQDPLNPLDNAQVTSQLAQISTVNGIEKLNKTLESMMTSNESLSALQSASLVGHNVLAPGNTLHLADGSAQAGFELADGADKVTITVVSAAGEVVHRANLSGLAAGAHTFEWDGLTDAGATAQAGNYSFTVEAKLGGAATAVQPLSVKRVDGVSRNASGLSISTSSGTVEWSQIKQVM